MCKTIAASRRLNLLLIDQRCGAAQGAILAVVEGANDHRINNVAAVEVDQDLGADSRREASPPIGTGKILGDPQPNSVGKVTGGTFALMSEATRIRPGTALPVELDAYPAIALAGRILAIRSVCRADDQRGLQARH